MPIHTYVIGDVQGCLAPLEALLKKIDFKPNTARLWFAGDLINRGPQSLEALRFIKQLPQETICVLGNHDMALLALAAQNRVIDPPPMLTPIFEAPDREELLNWLRHRPILHHDPKSGYTLTHAGIYPSWTLPQAQAYAQEVEAMLTGPDYKDLLARMYGNEPSIWDDSLQGFDRLRFIINAFTRMRFFTADGRLNLQAKGPPEDAPHLTPWFTLPNRAMRDQNIIFGHWAALETHKKCQTPHIFPIDTGCVWGKCLTAFCLENQQHHQIDCKPCL